MTITSNFKDDQGDLGSRFIPKTYLLDVYEYLPDSLKTAGLWLWGYNYSGQLGDGTTVDKSSPIQTIAGGSNWKQISAGYLYNAAIKTDGTLWTWGFNDDGQLGINSTSLRSSPVQTVAGGTNWQKVSSGTYHVAAIKTDGTLWLWGNDSAGQLGDNFSGAGVNKSSPVQTASGGTNWREVACGSYHTVAIKTDGTLWAWGYNGYGGLGDGTVVQKSTPVQIGVNTNWQQVSCGGDYTAAIKTDGTLWLWGENLAGQLGINSSGAGTHKSSPVQTVAGGTNWKQVACGFTTHTAAIKTDGTLWTWGLNSVGQLGDNTVNQRLSPVQTVAGGTNWQQVSCGFEFTSAIKIDGTLWTWGINEYGQLGNDTLVDKSSPIQTISGGTNWKQVSCGIAYHTAAIRDDSSDMVFDPVPPPPPPLVSGTNFASTENGATIGDGVVDGSSVSASYLGPNDYDTSMATGSSWTAVGCIFNNGSNVNNSFRSIKSNNSGTTFSSGGSSSSPLNIVVDLGQSRTFNHARYYQMFSDGKTTHAALDVSSTGNLETYSSSNWTQLHDFVALDNSATSEGVSATFGSTTGRYLRIRLYNDGTYGDAGYTELYNFKLFNI